MKKNLLAMICTADGKVIARKYFTTSVDSLQWAQTFSELGSYEIVVFRTTEDKPILRFGFTSIWDSMTKEVQA